MDPREAARQAAAEYAGDVVINGELHPDHETTMAMFMRAFDLAGGIDEDADDLRLAEERLAENNGRMSFEEMEEALVLDRWHVGEILAEELSARGWSPVDLAKKSGMSREATQAVLDGIVPIDRWNAAALAEAFGVSAQFFIKMQEACDRQN